MGTKGCDNLLWRLVPLSFGKKLHVIRTKYEQAKTTDECMQQPMVAIDANSIVQIAPKDTEMVKHAELIATMFSRYGIGVVIFADDLVKRHNNNRESMRRRCVNEKMKVSFVEKLSELSAMFQHLPAGNLAMSKSISKETRSIENELSRSLPVDFDNQLEDIVGTK